MHTHFSALAAFHIVLVVALANTFIRLASGRMVVSGNASIQSLGKALAFQV